MDGRGRPVVRSMKAVPGIEAGGGVEVSYRLGKTNGAGVELFSFADGGVATDLESSASPKHSRSLASTGVGARFSLAGTTVALEAGVPLHGAHSRPRLFASIFRSF